jgi:hypothetical protein
LILIPSSKKGSAELLSINDILTHFMTTDGRAALLAILALSTRHTSMNSFKTSQLEKGRDDIVPNAMLAIGMAALCMIEMKRNGVIDLL